MEFIDRLSQLISKAYDHEDEFLKRFFPQFSSCGIYGFYMGSDITLVILDFMYGNTLDETISTEEFIEWADSL